MAIDDLDFAGCFEMQMATVVVYCDPLGQRGLVRNGHDTREPGRPVRQHNNRESAFRSYCFVDTVLINIHDDHLQFPSFDTYVLHESTTSSIDSACSGLTNMKCDKCYAARVDGISVSLPSRQYRINHEG